MENCSSDLQRIKARLLTAISALLFSWIFQDLFPLEKVEKKSKDTGAAAEVWKKT